MNLPLEPQKRFSISLRGVLALLPAIIFGLAFGLGKIVRDCSLTCNVGYELSPIAILLIAFVAFPFSWVQSRYELRLGYLRWQVLSTVFVSLSIFVFWWLCSTLLKNAPAPESRLYQFGFVDHGILRWVYLSFYVWVGAILGTVTYNAFTNIFLLYPPEKRERWIIYATVCIASGGILGGWFSSQLFSFLRFEWKWPYETSRDILMLLMALAFLLHLPVVYVTHHFLAQKTEKRGSNSKTPFVPMRVLFQWIWQDPKIRQFAFIFLFGGVVHTLGLYLFYWVVSQQTDVSSGRTLFFSSFYIWLNLGSLLLLSFGTRKVIRKIGLVFTLLILPLSLSLGTLVFLINTFLMVMYAMRIVDGSLYTALHSPGLDCLLMEIEEEKSALLRSFLRGFLSRIGEALGACLVLVLNFGFHFNLESTSWFYFIALLCWCSIIFQLKNQQLNE